MPSKYGNRISEIDGVKFRSAAEARRYQDLKLMQNAGAIKDLTLQPRYPLVVNGVTICTYVADFRYWDTEKRCDVIEDVKGAQTAIYRFKKKLFEAVYQGRTIQEVEA